MSKAETRQETIARVSGRGVKTPELEQAIEDQKARDEVKAEEKARGPRTHLFRGRECPVTRTYYDSKNNLVFDVIEVEQSYTNRKTGKEVTVKLGHRVQAPPHIQKKYVIDYSVQTQELPGEVDVDDETEGRFNV